MAKRRKKSHRAPKGAGKGPARDADVEPVVESEDPLALRPWGQGSSSPEEAQDRALFEQAWDAFRRGDFRQCQVEATRLAEDATSGEVRRRSLLLLDRMRVDPLALGMAAVALSLLLTAAIWTIG
jgi:hypothetical protein